MTRLRAVGWLPLLFVVALVACPASASPLGPPRSSDVSPAAQRPLAGPPGAESCPVFPADNVWHADVSALPVNSHSAAWLSSMHASSKNLHPDFGPSGEAMPYGIPYIVVPGTHAKVSVAFDYADESDPGPYPFDGATPVEGGSDAHALMIDKDACKLYELYAAHYSASGSTAGSGAVFALTSNALRPAGWTSADAAGLPIFAGLVRLDEVQAGFVDHAIRVTAASTDQSYIWPARHQAGSAHNANLPPMGARFRLKASYDITHFRTDTQTILKAMKTYGLILADNGSDWFFQGTAENGWSTDLLDELKSVPAGAFEAVDESSLIVDPNSGQARAQTTAANVAVADFSFSPASVVAPRAQRLTFAFNGPSSHTVTDNSGMALYNSGPRSPGATYVLIPSASGNYPYHCTIHTEMTGLIRVPMTVTPGNGTTSTQFTVTWASSGPGAGFVFDVQIRRPGASGFTNWRTNTTLLSGPFVPNAGPGTYRFRARIRRSATGKASDYSGGFAIAVS